MKRCLVTVLVLSFCLIYNINFANKKIINEKQKKTLVDLLSPHWTIQIKHNQLEIASRLKMWFYNCISLPYYENKKRFYQEIVKKGRQDYFRITYVFKPKWSQKKINSARLHNRMIWKKIRLLPKKYDLSHLPKTKNNSFYSKKSDEKKRIEKYEQDYENLKAQTIILPDFHNKNWSIFIIENRMVFECVWIPKRIKLPLNQVQTILSNY